MIGHKHGLTAFNPPDDARQVQRAVVGRNACGKYILVAIGLGQLLFGRTSTTARRLLLLPSLASGTPVFRFQRVFFIQTLGWVLTVTIFELLLEPRVLRSQPVDHLLLVTNRLLQFSNRLPQFTNQFKKLIDAQLRLMTDPCRSPSVHPRLNIRSPEMSLDLFPISEWTSTLEVRPPIQMPGEKRIHWPVIRIDRIESQNRNEITKSIRVTDSPLRITIEPWSEEKNVIRSGISPEDAERMPSDYPHYSRFVFDESQRAAAVNIHLKPDALRQQR